MNKSEAKEFWPIIKAFSEGSRIQLKGFDGIWRDVVSPSFAHNREYRVKPKEWFDKPPIKISENNYAYMDVPTNNIFYYARFSCVEYARKALNIYMGPTGEG